jgi:hypothetical protein
MIVTLYTTPSCQPCRIAKRAMENRGIVFTTVDATDYADGLRSLGFSIAPVTVVQVARDTSAWQGFRPDCIELLAELAEVGPMPRCGLSDYETARAAILTLAHVRYELARHGANAQEFYVVHGQHPLYRGAVLLDWLGY